MTRRGLLALGLAATTVTASDPCRAQPRPGFAINRFEPAERGSGWFVGDGVDLRGHLRPSVGATLDLADKPLVVYDSAGEERAALVRRQLFAHLGASFVVWDRVRVGLDAPIAVYQDGEPAFVQGEALGAATKPALGDVRLAADVGLAGRYAGPIRLAIGVRGWLPTGSRSQFTSDGTVRLAPQLLAAGTLGPLEWTARIAYVQRFRDDEYAGSSLGSELAFAVGAGLRFGRFVVGPELFAATKIDRDAFASDGSPADALLGLHYEHASGIRLSAAIGSGLSRGFGSPAARGLLAIEWGRPISPPPVDRDGDGILDAADACPDVPGAASGDPEENGCPPPERVPDEDADQDGIGDRDDACPALPGIRTSDPMTNGCPPSQPRQLAVVTAQEIRIGERIQFATDSASLLEDSDGVLGAVARLLDSHPEIRRVRIEGHTDESGTQAHNDELSARRAEAVGDWLVAHGIAPARLESKGYGSRRPVAPNDTEEGRAANRRVVFTIVERAR